MSDLPERGGGSMSAGARLCGGGPTERAYRPTDGWRGRPARNRVLLIATAPVAPEVLRHALPGVVAPQELAALVVVPPLAQSKRRFRVNAASPLAGVGGAVAANPLVAAIHAMLRRRRTEGLDGCSADQRYWE